MLSGQAANTNFIAFGLTPPSFKITTYHIQELTITPPMRF